MTLTLVATVLSSGAVAAFVSFFLATRRDQFNSKQQKLEELYLAADEYDRMVAAVGAIALVALKNGLPVHSQKDALPAPNGTLPLAKARMEMLASFYFPAVLPAVAEHEKSRARMMNAMTACELGKGSFLDYDRAYAASEAVGERLRAAIIAEGQKYATFSVWRSRRPSLQ